MNWHQSSLFTTAIVLLGTTGCKADDAPADSPPSAPPTGYAWKTAYYKRGFMGNYKTEWGDGVGSTLRVRVPMPFAGSAVRVRLQPGRDIPVGLSKMGYNSTPNMPVRYPDLLGQLLGSPP